LTLGLFALALCPLVPGAARAQTTPDGAKQLEQQIYEWITSTLGPDVKIAQRPIQVTADGDHYDLAIPVGAGPDAPRWTATARERSGGRYAIDDVRFPSPSEFHVKLPDTVTQGGPPGMTADMTYKVSIGTQSAQMLIDPTFATATTSTSSVQNVDVKAEGGMAPLATHIDSGNGSFIIQPDAAGRLDVSIDSNIGNYSVDSEVPNAGPLKMVFGKTHVMTSATGISRERAVAVLQALIKLGKAAAPAPAGDPAAAKPSPAEAAAVILEALDDLASGAALDETIQDLNVTSAGMTGSLHAMQIGFGVKGVDGLLQAHLDLGAAGLTLPDLGLGSMTDLIPTKISLRPTVSGVPGEALLALLKASNAGEDPTPDSVMALFAKGPIIAGLDSVTIDVAGAEFTGLGKLTVASPQDLSGTAQITATNLDLLQQRIAAEPPLAQAVPVIIFLKGIGRTVGNQMIWDITYRGGRVLVNNQDLSALTGGPPPAPRPPGASPAGRPAATAPPALEHFPIGRNRPVGSRARQNKG
jgi:hypothetical protein